MAKYGYLKCNCSDPGKDYIESCEILDIDETGFTVGVERCCDFIGYKGSENLPTPEQAVAEMIKRNKEFYDKWYDSKYPEWFKWVDKPEAQYWTVDEDKDGRTYVTLYIRERIAVPFEFVKEHSNDNKPWGYSIKASWQESASDYDKEFRRVLGEWVHNIQLSDEYEACITHTWSLD